MNGAVKVTLLGIGCWVFYTAGQLGEINKAQEQEQEQRRLEESTKIFSTPEERRDNLVFKTKTPLIDSSEKIDVRLDNAIYGAIQGGSYQD